MTDKKNHTDPQRSPVSLNRPAEFKANSDNRILPLNFFDYLLNRLLPSMALGYIAAYLGLAWLYGGGAFSGFVHVMLRGDMHVYALALVTSLWVGIPGFTWLCLQGMVRYCGYARLWYKLLATLMAAILFSALVLLPDGQGWMRMVLVAALPFHLLMYVFLCILPMKKMTARVLNATAAVLLLLGIIL